LLAIAAPSMATPYDDELAKITHGLPRDVRTFIERRSGCNHWLGEEPYDVARKAEILKAVTELRCRSIARDEARIRHRYRRDSRILKTLRTSDF
jgi:hypothetical protein